MNLSPRWVERLGAASLTAVHWSSVGRVDAPDAEIMAYAAEHDFVVQIRSENLSPTSIGETLIAALQQMAPELAAGALLTIDPSQTRLRLLPLARR
jgi:predicted nuclease of predicted toxin-antitoxin system